MIIKRAVDFLSRALLASMGAAAALVVACGGSQPPIGAA